MAPFHAYSLGYRSRPVGSTSPDLIRYGSIVPTPSTSVAVPPTAGFPVSIDGRNYMVDTSFEPYRREAFRHKSIAPQRQSLHFTNLPDDGTVSTEGLWRREARDWSLGSGQIYFDRKASSDARFYRSKGVDPWTQWQLKLLPDTKARYTSGSSSNTVKAIRVGNYVYFQDGNKVYFQNYWPNQAASSRITSTVGVGTTTFSVSSTTGWPSSGQPFYIIVEAEIMLVTAWAYNGGSGFYDVTVVRGQQGTTAAGHGFVTVKLAPLLATGISGTILDIASDGYNVWVLTTAGLYCTIAGNNDGCATLFAFSPTLSPVSGSAYPASGIIAWAGGRLIMGLSGVTSIGTSSSTIATGGASLFDLSNAVAGTSVSKVIGYLSSNMTSSQTNIPVDRLTQAMTNNALVEIEGEIITLGSTGNSLGSTSMTGVTRGSSGTTAVAHTAGTPIYSINSTSAAYPTWGTSSIAQNQTGWIYTHPNPQWTWSGITGGSSQIYFAGHPDNTEDPGIVYRSTVTSSGATTTSPGSSFLVTPVVALPLPGGEYPTAIKNYLNYIFVGTNRGIRMCETLNALDPVGNTGDLKSGPLIPNITQPVTSPVTAIVGHDRYVYFSWNNYDSTSSGLGRMDLTQFIDPQAPAYASDLMITDQGVVSWLDWDPITDTPLISFDSATTASSIYTEDTSNTVAMGTVDSGLITYGIPDFKNAVSMDVNIDNISGSTASSVEMYVSVDGEDSIAIGSYSGASRKVTLPFPSQQFGEQYTVTTQLTAASNSNGSLVSPTLNRWTLKALPGIPSGITIMAVLLFYEPFEMDGTTYYQDPYVEYQYLEQLRQLQKVVTYVEGTWSAQVTVDLIDWLPERRRPTMQGGYHGDLVVTLKTVTG